jgi:hypothetical protein
MKSVKEGIIVQPHWDRIMRAYDGSPPSALEFLLTHWSTSASCCVCVSVCGYYVVDGSVTNP